VSKWNRLVVVGVCSLIGVSEAFGQVTISASAASGAGTPSAVSPSSTDLEIQECIGFSVAGFSVGYNCFGVDKAVE